MRKYLLHFVRVIAKAQKKCEYRKDKKLGLLIHSTISTNLRSLGSISGFFTNKNRRYFDITLLFQTSLNIFLCSSLLWSCDCYCFFGRLHRVYRRSGDIVGQQMGSSLPSDHSTTKHWRWCTDPGDLDICVAFSYFLWICGRR